MFVCVKTILDVKNIFYYTVFKVTVNSHELNVVMPRLLVNAEMKIKCNRIPGCWYRDPHGLPWIEYHHTGAPKIWYGVPDSHGIAFYTAMKQLVPTFCRKKPIWLPSDTAMVSSKIKLLYKEPNSSEFGQN